MYEEVLENTISNNQAYAQLRANFMVNFEFESNISIRNDEKRMREIFESYDVDKDGCLFVPEFIKLCQDCSSQFITSGHLTGFRRMMERDMRRVKETDANTVKEIANLIIKQSKNNSKNRKRIKNITFESFRRFFSGLCLFDDYAAEETKEKVKEDSKEVMETKEEDDHVGAMKSNRPKLDPVARAGADTLMMFRKKQYMYAFKTKDRATFSKSWGESVAAPEDYVLISSHEEGNGRDIYAISVDEFEKNYEPVTTDNVDHTYRKKGVVFARYMSKKFEVAVRKTITENGEEGGQVIMLSGNAGDFIVRPVNQNPYIVDKDTFMDLYEHTDIASQRHLTMAQESA